MGRRDRLNKKSIIMGIVVLFSALLTLPPVFASLSRDEIVEREMNCISDHVAHGKIDWDDVCSLSSTQDEPEPPSQAQDPSYNPTLPTHWEDAAAGKFLQKQYFGQRKTHSLDVSEEVFHYFYEEP